MACTVIIMGIFFWLGLICETLPKFLHDVLVVVNFPIILFAYVLGGNAVDDGTSHNDVSWIKIIMIYGSFVLQWSIIGLLLSQIGQEFKDLILKRKNH
jgi:hypothetical protein